MKRLKNELNALVNRGVDRHLRLAVTGLSRSGKKRRLSLRWSISCSIFTPEQGCRC